MGWEEVASPVQCARVSSVGSWAGSVLGPVSQVRGVQKLKSKERRVSQGAPTGNWSRDLHGIWVLWLVNINRAGGQVEVVVYVAAVQVAGWWEL